MWSFVLFNIVKLAAHESYLNEVNCKNKVNANEKYK